MTTGRLFGTQRQERLLAALRLTGAVRVRDLAGEFGVSELTVRRDIAALAQRGLVTKVHGGAVLPVRGGPDRQPRRAPMRFTVGMVVPSLDFYWPSIVGGARAAAAALGVDIRLRGFSYDPEEDRRQISLLVAGRQVQGLLLAPSLEGDSAQEMLDWIGRLQVPTVLVERQPRRWTPATRQIEWVRSDHALGLEIAVHHLRQQGHRRVGLVVAPGSPTSAHLLRAGQAATADPAVSDVLVLRDRVTLGPTGDRDAVGRLVRRCRHAGITALVVHSDSHAMAIAQVCAEHGLTVPDDLAIVSYDDEVAHLADPALTAIRPPKSHVGRLAVELMVSRLLDGERRPAYRVLLAPELVVRDSSRPWSSMR
ncbi:substrate-binding domain-containing protein [Micromonospora sp. NPDC000207]|uniref:substrate-binding domain-containing protein n=1 Tax=Micromonospora sp. NPDC000207 TaxID=3154246 RepID=UPI00331D1174